MARYDITSGVTSTGIILNNYDSMYVLNRGTANSTTISSGYMYVSSGGTANSTKVNNYNGYMYISSDGTANSTMISSGSMYVSSGGTANSTTVSGGGMYVGGTVNSTTISSGYMYVSSGGTANSTTFSGGYMYVSSGGTATNIIWTPCEGRVLVFDGGYATFASRYSGVYYGSGNQLLSSAASMNDKTLDSGYEMYVMSGGTANSTKVNNYNGYMYISSGGTANSTTISAGSMYVFSGGTANSTTISAGSMYVFSGGTANSTTVSGGGMYVSSGGTANSTTISSGGMYVSSGGTANSTTISSGNIYVGGTANSTTISSGYMYVSSGGTANSVTVNAGGYLSVASGGTATNIIWTPCDGRVLVSEDGYATFASRYSGVYYGSGNRLLSNAASMNDKTLDSGYTMYVMSGGTANSTTVNSYGGYMYISSGGTANSTTVNSYGSMYVYSGVANSTTISGGDMRVSSGGTANSTTISGGYMGVSSGGTANSTMVSAGEMYVRSGGTANSTTVNAGGGYYGFRGMIVGGTANNTTVNADGYLSITNGGIANNNRINTSGHFFISSGGTANNITVKRDGEVSVSSGGKLTGQTMITNGAKVSVSSGVILDFDISNLSPDADARINDLSLVSGWSSTSFTLTVRGTQTNGAYLLAEGASGFNKTISVVNIEGTSLGTLSVGQTVNVGGADYTLNLNDETLFVTVGGSTPPAGIAKSDIDGNGVSDVMFQWTGGNYQIGFWMNGQPQWQSQGRGRSSEWKVLGAHDMNGDGKADTVMTGEATIVDMKGTYIGYYSDGVDVDANWHTIGFLLDSGSGVAWRNSVGNLTGNESGTNSIVWYAPELYALGVWKDGREDWTMLSSNFGGEWWTMAGCGDFDGDGKDSVLMSGYGGQFLYSVGIDGVAHSHGDSNWLGWEVRAIGDFAGDGKDDIVLFHSTLGAMVMLVDGNTDNYESLGQLDVNDWFIVGAGDYNGDSRDDLLVRQYSTGMLGCYSSGDTTQWVEMGRGVDMNWTVIA